MALRKTTSRIIVIDGIKYRWMVSPNDGYNVFVAQGDAANGRIIEVYFRTDVNAYWVNFPYVQDLNLKIIKPKDAETIIRQALKHGWNPEEETGSPIVFDFNGSCITRRIKGSLF